MFINTQLSHGHIYPFGDRKYFDSLWLHEKRNHEGFILDMLSSNVISRARSFQPEACLSETRQLGS